MMGFIQRERERVHKVQTVPKSTLEQITHVNVDIFILLTHSLTLRWHHHPRRVIGRLLVLQSLLIAMIPCISYRRSWSQSTVHNITAYDK